MRAPTRMGRQLAGLAALALMAALSACDGSGELPADTALLRDTIGGEVILGEDGRPLPVYLEANQSSARDDDSTALAEETFGNRNTRAGSGVPRTRSSDSSPRRRDNLRLDDRSRSRNWDRDDDDEDDDEDEDRKRKRDGHRKQKGRARDG